MFTLKLSKMAGSCLHGQPPPCSGACPFGFDVSNMFHKIKGGNHGAGYKTYAKAVVFPGLVSLLCPAPCQDICKRKHIDANLVIREVEHILWRENHQKPESAFYVPQKNKAVRIIGGGLCGMTCAMKLSGRGYSVQLLEKKNCLGGRLWTEVSGLPPGLLEWELECVHRQPNLEIITNRDGLAVQNEDYAAIVDATGKSLPGKNGADGILVSVSDGDCFIVDGILRGIELANAVESYLKIGAVKLTAAQKPTWGKFSHSQDHSLKTPVLSEPLDILSAQKEAGRCLHCTCLNCVDVCDMHKHYGKTPPKTLLDVNDTLNKTELNSQSALRQIMSCTQCGLCSQACPEEIDFKRIYIESRRQLQRTGKMPLAHYDYWLNDLAFSNSEAALDIGQEPGSVPIYLYFPGCQMGASDPEYVMRSFSWLRRVFPGQVALMLHCCGAPAYWMGDVDLHENIKRAITGKWRDYGEPTVILACPTCKNIFRGQLPDIRVISLWEIMAERYVPSPKKHKTIVSVFDPCASKYAAEDQSAIRTLLRSTGCTIEELPASGAQSRCCGFGGLAYSGNPAIVEKTRAYNGAMGLEDYVTYCANCRESFALEGKIAYHILDWLFFEDRERGKRMPPDLGKRRDNRLELKEKLLSLYGGEKPPARLQNEGISLEIPEHLMEKMNKNLMLREQAHKVVAFAEVSGNKLYDENSGNMISHLRQGQLTFWVEYRALEQGGYLLENIYFHRCIIEEKEPEIWVDQP